jgi:PASTA domain
MGAPHAHSLDVKVTGGQRRTWRREHTRNAAGVVAAVVLAVLIAGQEDRGPFFIMTPALIDFGPRPVGSGLTPAQGLTLENRGFAPVALTRLVVSGNAATLFRVQDGECAGGVVPPGRKCVVNVAFDPQAAGNRTESLRLDGAGPLVELRGEGTQPPTPAPPVAGRGSQPPQRREPANTVDTPSIKTPTQKPLVTAAHFLDTQPRTRAAVDSTAAVQVVLKNTGETTIQSARLRLEGGHASDFSLANEKCPLGAPGAQCAATVTFSPHDAGEHSTTIIAESENVTLDTATVTGDAIVVARARAEITPTSLQFSKRDEMHWVIVRNAGDASLRLAEFTLDNTKDFSLDSSACTKSSPLPADRGCSVFVRFTGRAPAAGHMTIAHGDPTSSTSITLSAPRAPAFVEVPKLVESDQREALDKLKDRGLVAGKIAEETRCESIHRVVAQSPERNQRVLQGSAVDFTVATYGSDPAIVPSVERQPRPTAQAAIQAARLSVAADVRTEETDNFRPGTVTSVRPKPGTMLAPNCPVMLTIAVAVPKLAVPPYTDRTLASAKETLRSGLVGAFAWFRLGDVRAIGGDVVPKGEDALWMVTSQDPKAGEQWPRGTAINLTVRRTRTEPPVIQRVPTPTPNVRTPVPDNRIK